MNAVVAALAGVFVAPVILIGAATGALTGTSGTPVEIGAPTEPAATAIGFAREQLGVPYRWGEETPGVGFDCSGLTWAAYAEAGIALPRTAQTQYDAGPLLPPGTKPQPGDLVFFGTPTRVHHVGLVIDTTQMIAAPHTGAVVRIQPFAAGDLLGFSRPSLRAAPAPGAS
ncbi:MAG TPA: C40 family peptidase [Mycobacteriales bacterium]|jgi:cell wall-associated NlpC family hydrolase|nr:C40 family peptidase [Mycobacteriales bacterium]